MLLLLIFLFLANQANSLFVRLISHQPTVLFSQNKPATNNQPAVLFSHSKSAPAISHQRNEQAVR
jgi:predicted esterase